MEQTKYNSLALTISKWWCLLIVSSAVFLSVIDIFIVNVALPSIQKGIHGSDGDVQLVIALYLLGYAAFLVTGGRAGDFYGKRKVLVWSMVLFTLASGICGAASAAPVLNAARFVQGIGAGFMVPQGIAYVQLLFPCHNERMRALGIYGSIAGAASVIGQLLGGVLPDISFAVDGWRLIFFINLPVGIAAAVLAARYLPEQVAGKNGRFDYRGVLLLTAALLSLIYPMVHGREAGWPWWCIVLPLLGVLLLVLFVADQRKKTKYRQAPLIDFSLFNYFDFNIGLCIVLFYFMVQDSYFLVNAIFLQKGMGIGSSQTGWLFVCQGLGYVTASLAGIRLVARYGKKVIQAGVGIMITGLLLHMFCVRQVVFPRNWFSLVLFMYGTGCGSVLPSLLTLALKNIPPAMAGAAAGTYSTFQQTAIALGVCITGGIFFYALGNTSSLPAFTTAYYAATWFNIALLVVVSVLLRLLPGSGKEAGENNG